MTTASSIPVLSDRRAPSAEAAAPALAVLRWTIGASGLLAASTGSAMLNGHAASLQAAALEIGIGVDGSVVAALLVELRGADGVERLPIELPARRAAIEHLGEHLHVHLDGVVTLVIRLAQGSRNLRYARTDLLATRLGLAGGVYDAPSLI